MTPFFEVWSNGEDISGRMRTHGVECTVTENAGGNSDTVTFAITDPEAKITPPGKGTTFSLVAGVIDPISGERTERDFGKFKVDQIGLGGYPHEIQVSAQSVDVSSRAKEKRTKAYKIKTHPTYKEIFEDIAKRNKWELKLGKEIAVEVNRYEAQSEEDDIQFATRLGLQFDASVSVKDGKLVVMKKGTGKTVSGKEVGPYVIEPDSNLLEPSGYSTDDFQRPKHGKVKAKWYDRKKAEQKVEEEETVEDGPDFEIPEVLPSEEEARRAAKSKATELARAAGKATFSVRGDINVQAGCFVLAKNIRPEVDGLWSSTSVTHHFSGNSLYYNTIECEVPSMGRKKAAEKGKDGEGSSSSKTRANVPKPKPKSPYAPNEGNLGLNEGDGPE